MEVDRERLSEYLSVLVTSGMIRARLGFPHSSSVHRRIERSGFPDPVATFSRTKVWVWDDVVEWCERRSVPFLSPDDLVELSVVEERLSIGYAHLLANEVTPTVVDGVERWLWSDVEATALATANTALRV